MAKKKANFTGLNNYLMEYYNKYQKSIIVVYRGDASGSWAKRCLYLSPKYSPMVEYNHRQILDDEIVIEYDNEDVKLNSRLADKVSAKLRADGILFSKWHSGNKSEHIHLIVKKYDLANKELFKKAIMKHYGTYYYDEVNKIIYDKYRDGLTKLTCDLRLSGANHLIRAEYGLHEKTGEKKRLLWKSADYPKRSKIPVSVFEKYTASMERSVQTKLGLNIDPEHDIVKNLMDTVKFKEGMNDGRERVMFALIHILKPKFKPGNMEGLVSLIDSWYNYCSTQRRKMTRIDIQNKVRYHWTKDYRVTINTLKKIMDEVGGTI